MLLLMSSDGDTNIVSVLVRLQAEAWRILDSDDSIE